ncbi:MAG: glycerophosphodiester phosphodiesterase family protein [Hyphomonadaceae bacterium]
MRRVLIAATLAMAACEATPARTEPTVAPPGDLPAFFDCLREQGLAAVSAHRGGPAPGYAENAIPTFEHTRSVAPGVFLEVDVSETADGVLVLMHDDRAERTTTGSGAIEALDMEQLLAFQLEDERGRPVDARVPTLAEALEWADGRAVLELDIKRGVAYEDVIRAVDAAGAMGRVVFVTYSVDGAARLARLAPQAIIYTTISDARELAALERRGVELNRVVAWVGSDAPPAALVEALAARSVETRFGMFGEERDYSHAARSGAQIIAVDDPAEAVRDLGPADDDGGYVGGQCAGDPGHTSGQNGAAQ